MSCDTSGAFAPEQFCRSQRRSRRSHSAEASAATSGSFLGALLSSGSEVRTRNRHQSHQTFATMDRADELFFFFFFLSLSFFVFVCLLLLRLLLFPWRRMSPFYDTGVSRHWGTRCPFSVTLQSVLGNEMSPFCDTTISTGRTRCPLSVTLQSVLGERDVPFL